MTDVSLREFFEAELKGLDLRFRDFKESLDERLSKMNEIREQLTDQAGRMATKESVEAIDKRINALIWFGIVALVAVLTTIAGAVATFFLNS